MISTLYFISQFLMSLTSSLTYVDALRVFSFTSKTSAYAFLPLDDFVRLNRTASYRPLTAMRI